MADVKIVVADIRDTQFIPHTLTVSLDSGFRLGTLLKDNESELYDMARKVFDIAEPDDSVCGFIASDDTVNLSGIGDGISYEEFLNALRFRYDRKRKFYYGQDDERSFEDEIN